jgi:hypothetical protein
LQQAPKISLHTSVGSTTQKKYRVLIVAMLAILSIQAWFGDFVNIFVAPSSGLTPPPYSIAGFFQGVDSLGFTLIWHAFEGIAIVVIGAALVVLSFRWSNARGVRIESILGFFFVLMAAAGGHFVRSFRIFSWRRLDADGRKLSGSLRVVLRHSVLCEVSVC